jgi:GT2 family glycosyltransferase
VNFTIAVVIVAWNNYLDTQECIDSIFDQQIVKTKIFLVDNGSDIEPLVNLSIKYPDINYIRSDTNLGFAGGYNLGLQKALMGDYHFFLIINNDTKADQFMIYELVEAFKDEKVGLAAPIIYYYDAPNRVWSSGGNINKLFLMPLESHSQRKKITSPTERTFISGCCYLLKRDLLEQVGLFDERFFLYFEDLDLCMRINKSQWRMIVIPTAKLWHKVSRSSGGQDSERERYHYALSSVLYFQKHISVVNAIPISLFRLGSALKTTITLLLRGETKGISGYFKGIYMGLIKKKSA